VGVSLVELLWGLGMPPLFESAFLQLFLHHLGASSLLIGLVPSLAAAGSALSSLLSYSLTSHLERRRTAVIVVHAGAALPILIFGLTLGVTGIHPSTLGLFLVLFAVFSMVMGLVLPVWQNYLMKIFSETRVVPAMAVLMITQSVGKLVGSLFLVRIVERYSFSASGASLVFTIVGLLFLMGALPFLLTAEEPGVRAQGVSGNLFRATGRASLRRTFSNGSFLLFLGTDLEYFALSGVLAFYANYATQFCGVSPALASGLFMACNYLGGVLANGLLGWANLLSRRSKYLVTKALALSWLILLSAYPAPWVFYTASLAFGASRGTRLMVFAPSVKRLSGQPDATLYFAVAPILALPFSTGLPLLNGAFLDRFAFLGADAFKIMFLGMAVLCLAGLLFATRMPLKETQ
jgi:MFS family permease